MAGKNLLSVLWRCHGQKGYYYVFDYLMTVKKGIMFTTAGVVSVDTIDWDINYLWSIYMNWSTVSGKTTYMNISKLVI